MIITPEKCRGPERRIIWFDDSPIRQRNWLHAIVTLADAVIVCMTCPYVLHIVRRGFQSIRYALRVIIRQTRVAVAQLRPPALLRLPIAR